MKVRYSNVKRHPIGGTNPQVTSFGKGVISDIAIDFIRE